MILKCATYKYHNKNYFVYIHYFIFVCSHDFYELIKLFKNN